MLVRDIVSLAAENLGRDDLSAALAALDGEPEGELASLLRCYNLVENEVALDYFPLREEETLSAQEGKLFYTALSHAPVDICRVTDASGNKLPFEAYPVYLSLPDGETEVTIVYAYAPESKSLSDESAFSGKISARLLSLGVACEFCLTGARFQEAAMWEKRFREALRAAGVLRRRLCMRSRRWL